MHNKKEWDREVYKEKVDKSDLYFENFGQIYEKYFYNDGKKLVIPELLGEQRFVAAEIKKRFGIDNFLINYIDPTVGAHSGPGTLALFYMGDIR